MWVRLQIVGPLLSGLILTLFLVLWVAHTSAWFMWGTVAGGSGSTFFFSQTDLLQPTVADLESRYQISASLPLKLTHVRRLALHTEGSTRMLAAIPVMGQGDAVKQQLTQNGWVPRRLGGLIIASRGLAPLSGRTHLMRGFRELAQHIGPDRLPAYPLAIVHISSNQTALLPQGLRGVLFARRHGLEGVGKFGDQWPRVTRPSTPAAVSTAQLEFSLPGHWLDILPADIQDRWQEDTWKKLSLEQSRPDTFGTLKKYQTVSLQAQADSHAIAVLGDSDGFAQEVEVWLQTEQGYRLPVTAAFRLPDGTLGYEKRPSTGAIIWQATPDGACRTTALGDNHYWFCRAGEAAAVANSENGARRAASHLSSTIPWHLTIGAELARKVIAPPAVSISLQPDREGQVTFRLDTAY